ncbi:hypothetical protein M2352_003475 [Azospirillum fermentarium]|uniref:hypothetical protein n=1 Tax=Azospirillum fermentarium TaxID=1233114 RepID=UPI0022270EEF|nr:hypothetical protein [Azospirillum fermentarium]MCW2247841.1 hypothetical protein [Azospirillum fermentarium]
MSSNSSGASDSALNAIKEVQRPVRWQRPPGGGASLGPGLVITALIVALLIALAVTRTRIVLARFDSPTGSYFRGW